MTVHRRILVACLSAAWLIAAGCGFSERTIPLEPGDVAVLPANGADGAPRLAARAWLAQAQPRLARLLGRDADRTLLTADLCGPTGQPIDVLAHFSVKPSRLRTIWGNWAGLRDTARGAGTNRDFGVPAPPWPGYRQVWIPVGGGVELSGRLRLAGPADRPARADCIVILPGFFGDCAISRTKCLADALAAHGRHVLALELRGHGQTEIRHPEAGYTFGVLESGDLLAVAEWLEAMDCVDRTGLMGFSLGADHALLTAWREGLSRWGPEIPTQLARRLRPPCGHRHYQAGVLAFSPAPDTDRLIDRIDGSIKPLADPVLANLQQMVRTRAEYKRYPHQKGNLRELIGDEVKHCPLDYPGAAEDGIGFARLMPLLTLGQSNKLAAVRVPVVIVHAANDPIGSAQEVADLLCGQSNPNVAAVVLPGGGHVGFAPYARAWFYSLVLDFFDPETGPAPVDVNEEAPNGKPHAARVPAPARRCALASGETLWHNFKRQED